MKFSINDKDKTNVFEPLQKANLAFQKIYPGDKPERQPVHTVYGGANLFKSDTTVKMGDVALRNLMTYAPDFVTLANVLKLQGYEHLPHLEKDIQDLTEYMDNTSEAERKKNVAWLSYSIYKKIV